MYHDTLLDRMEEEEIVFIEDTREHIALILEDNTVEVVFDDVENLQYYSKVGDLKIVGHVVLDDENYSNKEVRL